MNLLSSTLQTMNPLTDIQIFIDDFGPRNSYQFIKLNGKDRASVKKNLGSNCDIDILDNLECGSSDSEPEHYSPRKRMRKSSISLNSQNSDENQKQEVEQSKKIKNREELLGLIINLILEKKNVLSDQKEKEKFIQSYGQKEVWQATCEFLGEIKTPQSVGNVENLKSLVDIMILI